MARNLTARIIEQSIAGVLATAIVLGIAGCHTAPITPVAVIPPPVGTVRILGAVALPQVATIPAQGLTLNGAVELAGGVVTDQQQTTKPAPAAPADSGFDVKLTSPPVGLPAPRNTLFIFTQQGVLSFSAFDGNGQRFLAPTINETTLSTVYHYMLPADFKIQLTNLMSANRELTADEKRDIVERTKAAGEAAGIS